MLSKGELKKKIASILEDADLDKISAKKVRAELEGQCDADLSDRKDEINGLITEVMDEMEGDKEEEDDEPPPKRAKNGKKTKDESEEEASESDYEPDSPPRNKKKSTKKRASRGSDSEAGGASSGEEWGSRKKKKTPKSSSKKSRKRADSDGNSSDSDFKPTKKAASKKKGGGGNGFTKPLNLSAELADIVGTDVAPRHEVVKQMWAYIKSNNLQDPKNKQFAICDEKLKKVIGEKKFKCFGMAKYLKHHMTS